MRLSCAGWPAPDSGVTYDFWVALVATAFHQRRYIDEPLIAHRLHDDNASGWIVSDKEILRWKSGDPDVNLLIDLCIRQWNLAWTDAFLGAVRAREADLDEADTSVMFRALAANRAYHGRLRRFLRRLLRRFSFGAA